ncbi:MAG: hypothetical protein L3K13_06555, partial [Thermoplasmata archaeon]|nr:hypothetical protein [Thermoplasmata archaeon]
LNLTGIANVTFWYAPAWWLTVSATAHGSATPKNEWVLNASGVLLTATPQAGFVFVGWSGSGPGSTTSAQRHSAVTVIHPTGPVVEIATFAPRPPPTWKVTVSENGMPTTQPYTVQLGASAYTGSGTFAITNLSTNSYTLGVPYVFDNGTVGVRYVPGVANSSLVLAGGSLLVDANGTLTVPFSTQYLLTVGATAGGTVSPNGAGWKNAGAQLALTATASNGFSFTGWNGTGTGARTSKNPTVTVVVGGVISETAQFTAIPHPPPATYSLMVSEQGLPPTATWALGVGTASASGSGALSVNGLNGSYTLTVPTVYVTAGIRYIPNGSATLSVPVALTSQNATRSVVFTEQVLVTLETSGQGTVTGTSGWVSSGSPIQLSATPATGWLFAGWVGTGTGSSSTTNASATSITPTGPVVETATFTPAPPPVTKSGSSTAGLTTAVGLLVALLIAGLLVGMLLARRRRRSPPPPEPMESWQETPADTENASMDSSGMPPGSS